MAARRARRRGTIPVRSYRAVARCMRAGVPPEWSVACQGSDLEDQHAYMEHAARHRRRRPSCFKRYSGLSYLLEALAGNWCRRQIWYFRMYSALVSTLSSHLLGGLGSPRSMRADHGATSADVMYLALVLLPAPWLARPHGRRMLLEAQRRVTLI